MIRVISKSVFKKDKIEEAKNLYKILAEKSRKETGCISYNLYQEINDNSILTMVEEWESTLALDNHKNSEHFKSIVPKLGLIRKSSELNIYKLVL